MTNWPSTRLRDVLASGRALISGPFGSNISSKFFVETGVPVIRGNNLSEGLTRFIDEGFVFVTTEKADALRCDATADDLIFTAAGSIGQVGIIPRDPRFARYVISNKQIRARLDDSRVLPLFAFYWFSQPAVVDDIKAHNTGSTIPLINLKVVGDLRLSLPPLREQAAIVEVLSALDDKIELNRRVNQTLEAMAQAIFRDWFVDFGPVRRKLAGERDPVAIMGGLAPDPARAAALAALFPDALDDDGLPKGWMQTTIGQSFDVKIGRTPPRKEHHHFLGPDGGVPWFSIRDMGGCGAFIVDAAESIDPASASQFRIAVIAPETVVVSFKLTVGRVAITAREMMSNEAIAQLATLPSSPSAWFGYCALRCVDFDGLGSTSSIAHAVNSNTIRAIELLRPSRECAGAFDEIAAPLFTRIKQATLENRTLAETRDYLLPRLMCGKVRVAEAAEAAEAAA